MTDGSTVGSAFMVKPATPYETDMRDLCTTGPSVRITRIRPWKPFGGIRIVDWGVRVDSRDPKAIPAGPDEGGKPIKVSQVGGFTTGPVTVKCHSKSADQRFYVSVTAGSKRSAMYGASIYYGHGHRLNTQMTIVVCTTGTIKTCATPKGY